MQGSTDYSARVVALAEDILAAEALAGNERASLWTGRRPRAAAAYRRAAGAARRCASLASSLGSDGGDVAARSEWERRAASWLCQAANLDWIASYLGGWEAPVRRAGLAAFVVGVIAMLWL